MLDDPSVRMQLAQKKRTAVTTDQLAFLAKETGASGYLESCSRTGEGVEASSTAEQHFSQWF